MDRRDFFLRLSAVGLGSMAGSLPGYAGPQRFLMNPADPDPTPAQRAWLDLGFGMFIHFGINTYYDAEWSDGSLDPVRFNPGRLNTDQWCAVAKEAGMKYIVLITKHHDGFCLWPSKDTTYSVAASPWKGNLVAELVNSAHKHDLKVGFYYSLWDRHEKNHDSDERAYVDFMKRQLQDLLTNYGEIVELWFDGFWKKQQHGWIKRDREKETDTAEVERRNQAFIQAWRMEGAYRWQMDHLYQFIKELQPNCLVMNNSTTAYPGVPLHPVDIRSGEKYTSLVKDQKIWPWLGKDIFLPLQIETTMSVKGNEQFPSGNWFWHEWDKSALSREQIQEYRKLARSMDANLLLNVGPDPKGLLRPIDEQTLRNLEK